MADISREATAARARGAPRELVVRATPCPSPEQRGAGAGALAFERVDGATSAVRCEARSPLQLHLTRRRGTSAWAVVATHGGGLVAGDAVALDVEVRPEAAALLTSQAESKAYRADARGGTRQLLAARVGAGGVLAALPDATSVFAGARHAQAQRYDLASGASLLAVDALVAGRTARGERWAFTSASARTEVRVGGRLVLADALALAPARGGPLAARLAPFEAFATAVALGPAFRAGARELLAGIAARPVERGAAVLASASPLEDGLLLRAAAATPELLAAFLRGALGFAADALGDDPFSRRW